MIAKRLIDFPKNWIGRRMLSQKTRAVVADRITYLSIGKLRRLENALSEIEINAVPGDLFEFGIALGGSAIIIAEHAYDRRRFHGLDVFEMIPPPTSDKDDPNSKARYEVIRSGRSQGIGGDEYYGYRLNLYDDVKDNFRRHGCSVDGDRIQLHKGLFEQTWPTISVEQIAFAHIDCDWYDPVKYCLEAVCDKLSYGGILLIDDYNQYGGSRAAVDEFLATHRNFEFEPGSNPILRRR